MEFERYQSAVCASVDAHAASYIAASDAIWDHPEVNFHEDFASARLRALLSENGFAVTDRLGGMPNAFRAEYGEGNPVIAFLCEYDALSAMSQQPLCAVREPLTPGAPGHGCGQRPDRPHHRPAHGLSKRRNMT